jgi:hypothetical protein
MSNYTCHCTKPATWFVRVVPAREVVLVEGHIPEFVLGVRSIASWAACDEHLAEATRGLVESNDLDDAVLVIRPEGE